MKQFSAILTWSVLLASVMMAGCSKKPANIDDGDPQQTKLDAPVLSKESGSTWYTIEWQAVPNATGYRVSTDEGASWEDGQTAVSFQKTGLTPETKYVVMVKSAGDAPYTDSDPARIEVTTTAVGVDDLVKLTKPELSVQTNVRNARISWTAVENATGYSVSTDGCTTWSAKQAGTYFEYSDLSPETAYTVHVKALGDGTAWGDSDAAEIGFTTAPDTYIPGEYSYLPVIEDTEIVSGQKYLIGYVLANHVRIMDVSGQKPAAIDLSAQYNAAEDLFPSNAVTDKYAYTIKDAGSGYYYIVTPDGRNLGWTSSTNFNYSATGNNAKWSIVDGNDGDMYSFLITNVAAGNEVASRRGIIYRYYVAENDKEQSYDLFAPYAYNNIDLDEYLEPCLYMLNKPVDDIDPTPDPDPEPGETLKYIPLTDPGKLYSGDKCLVVYADAGEVRVMNYELGVYDEYETPEERPAAIDLRTHYSASKNMFDHNATTSQYEFTFSKASAEGYYLVNGTGEFVTAGAGSAISFEETSSGASVWTLSKGSGVGAIRIGNGTRSIGYNSYTDYAGEHCVFGNYSNDNIGTGSYKEAKLYILKGVKVDGDEEPEPTEETGFPATWDMSSATITSSRCYATSDPKAAYIYAPKVNKLSFSAGQTRALVGEENWNADGASWMICVPVTNMTKTGVSLSFRMLSSAKGPRKFAVKYSTDGSTYKSAGNSNNFAVTNSEPKAPVNIDFTPEFTGFPKMLYIRLEVSSQDSADNKSGSKIAADGTCRIYDVKLTKRP